MHKQLIMENKWYKKLLELLVEDYIHTNPFSRPGISLASQSAIVWHYTANPGAGDENHKAYFDSLRLQNRDDDKEDRYASAHIFIDKDSGRIIIPLWEIAYHAGNSWYNRNALSCELCIEKDGTFHPQTVARAVKVGALLHLLFDWTTDKNMRHYDITRKNCPKPWAENPALYKKFKQEVEAEIKRLQAEPGGTPNAPQTPNAPLNKCSIKLNGRLLRSYGFLDEGKSLLPVRAVAEASGSRVPVNWCEETRKVLLAGKALESSVVIDGIGFAWSVEIAEALDFSLQWDGATKTVELKGCV